MKLRAPIWIQTGFLVALLGGCASTPTPSASVALPSDDAALKAAQIEPKARQAFLQAERNFKAKKYKAAADGYRNLKTHFAGTSTHQVASYRLGSIFYVTGNYPQASQEFQSYLTTFPKSELSFDVTYNLAASEFQQQHYAKAYEVIRRLSIDSVRAQGPRRAEVVYQLASQAASNSGSPTGALLYTSYYLQNPLEEVRRRQLEAGVGNYLNQIQSVEELNTLLVQVSEPSTRAKIAERLAALSPAPTPLAQGASLPGVAPLAGASSEPAAPGLTSATSADSTHIGVVLPLSGALAQYGKRALDGILLAAGVFQRQGGRDIEIFVEDSGSNPATAAQAVERLVQENSVIAVIGPISWKESLAVADKAQELGVLNLSLTGKEGISERGAYLFQNALTPRVQMESLVKHCIQEKRFRRFAILAPDNKFGEDMATEFTTVANKLGGRIVGYETYAPEAKDFQSAVQKLGGLSDPRYRKLDSSKLDQFVKDQGLKSKRPSKARLPPIVDFDAIFLPDGPKAVAQIAASLAYFDVTGVTLLGTSEWNSDQLYKRGGRLVEGAIFPAGLMLSGSGSKQRDFVRQYAEAYGGMPDLLAAQAYEAVELVAQAAENSAGNRNAAVSAMMALGRFESPLGQLSFDPSRIASRALPILTLAPGGNIVEQ